jgi:carboxyl-terminal processing protease
MSSKSRWLIFAVSTPLVIIAAVGGLLGASPARQQTFPQLSIFNEVVELIRDNYVEPVDTDKVMEGAMRGLAEELDPESAYLTSDEVVAINAATVLGPADAGVTVTRQFYLRVLGVREGSPAARAGLLTDDFIRAIDGKSTRDMSAFTGTRLLHGAPGSKVTLTVIRGNAAEPHIVELTRDAATMAPTTSRRLPTGEGYLHLATFAPGTAALLTQHIDALRQAGAATLVIDLRGTSDGSIDEGIAAARLFVKTGTLAIRAGRDNRDRVTIAAQAGDGAITIPVELLVSSGTADAFAAALDAAHRAELVGEHTAGLAGVQHLITLPDGRGLWMTDARYLLPDGTPILEHGLEPAIAIDTPRVAFDDVAPSTDATLMKALERLKMKKAA